MSPQTILVIQGRRLRGRRREPHAVGPLDVSDKLVFLQARVVLTYGLARHRFDNQEF